MKNVAELNAGARKKIIKSCRSNAAFDLWAKCRDDTSLVLLLLVYFLLPVVAVDGVGAAAAVGELVNKQPKPTRFPCFATLLRCCFFFVGLLLLFLLLLLFEFIVLDLGLRQTVLLLLLLLLLYRRFMYINLIVFGSIALTMFATMWELFGSPFAFVA